jgi:hypothetical protein
MRPRIRPSGYGERGRAPWPAGVPGWIPSCGWGWYVPAGYVVADIDRPGEWPARADGTGIDGPAARLLDRSPWLGATRRGLHAVYDVGEAAGLVGRGERYPWGELYGPGSWLHGHGYLDPSTDISPPAALATLLRILGRPADPPAARPALGSPLDLDGESWIDRYGRRHVVRVRRLYVAAIVHRAERTAQAADSRHLGAVYLAQAAVELSLNGEPAAAEHCEDAGLQLCQEARGSREGRREWRGIVKDVRARWGR